MQCKVCRTDLRIDNVSGYCSRKRCRAARAREIRKLHTEHVRALEARVHELEGK